MLKFLKVPSARFTTLLLLVLICAYYAYPKNEIVLLAKPLKEVPLSFGGWQMVQESQLETEVLELLRADDTLNRVYARSGQSASLYVAFFKTQKTGVAPHSPKVCLPGSGWVPLDSGEAELRIPSRPEPIQVNRYIVAHGEAKSVVYYWYQTPYRVIASEYSAKIYTVIDSFLHRRSDTSLVRVVVPAYNGDIAKADEIAKDFIGTSFTVLRDYLPH